MKAVVGQTSPPAGEDSWSEAIPVGAGADAGHPDEAAPSAARKMARAAPERRPPMHKPRHPPSPVPARHIVPAPSDVRISHQALKAGAIKPPFDRSRNVEIHRISPATKRKLEFQSAGHTSPGHKHSKDLNIPQKVSKVATSNDTRDALKAMGKIEFCGDCNNSVGNKNREDVKLRKRENTNSELTKQDLDLLNSGGRGSSTDNCELPYYMQFHNLFVRDHDLDVGLGSLVWYAGNNRTVDRQIPVGASTEEHVSPVDEVRLLLRKSVKILKQLHDADRTLDGKFDFTNFEVYKNMEVKLCNIAPGTLKRLTKKGSDADYSKFAMQADHHFFGRAMPTEMALWLCLLLTEATAQEYLAVNCISLKQAKKALSHFGHLYTELLYLSSNHPAHYKEIIKYPDERHGGWQEKAKQNSYTRYILERKDSHTRKEAKYGKGAEHLLRLCRNLTAHAFDKELSKQLHLRYKEVLAIINSFFPGLLMDFERIMHERIDIQALVKFQ